MERIDRSGSSGRTVTLKVKFADFRQITRAKSFVMKVSGRNAIGEAGHALLAALLPVPLGIRLLGLTLSSLSREEEDSAPAASQLGLDL